MERKNVALSKMTLKICQDLDNVIFDLQGEFIEIYNEKYGTKKTSEDVTHYHFYEDWGITREECFDIFDNIDQRDCELLNPYIPSYLEIMNEVFDVDIVTLKPIENKKNVLSALQTNGITSPTQYNKLRVLSYEIPDIKGYLPYDIYIDDSEKLGHMLAEHPDKILLLYDGAWNKSVPKAPNIKRVKNWEQILKILLSEFN